jgi:hypothetical protein
MLGGSVTTARHVLGLRMEGRPPAMEAMQLCRVDENISYKQPRKNDKG